MAIALGFLLAAAPGLAHPPSLADLLEPNPETAASPAGSAATVAVQRLPVPTPQQQARAGSTIREVFGVDAANARTPAARIELGNELRSHASDERDAVMRYVLLDAIRGLYAEAGAHDQAIDVIAQISATYDVDGDAMIVATYETMATKCPPQELGPVIDGILTQAASRLDAGGIMEAESLCKRAMTAAKRGRDADRQKAAAEQLALIREVRKLRDQTEAIEERLKENPGDRDAALELGIVRCLVEERWEEGLPLLVRGSDAQLSKIAILELKPSGDPQRAVNLADQWYEYSRSQKGPQASACLRRAQSHYSAALEGLSGVAKARVEKRLEQIAESGAAGSSARWGPLHDLIRKLGGAVVWLDANDSQGLQGTTKGPARVNSSVSAWLDVGGSGKGFAALAAESAPRLVSSAGGRRAITFDGVDDCLVGTRWPSGMSFPLSVAIVFAPAAPNPGASGIRMLLDNAHYGADKGFCLQLFPNQTGFRLSAGTEVVLPAGDGWRVVVAVFGDRSCQTYVNGMLGSSSDRGVNNAIQPSCFLGCWGEANGRPKDRFFAGAIGECIILRRALSQQEIAALSGLLITKWQK